ncbi:3-hydroxyacyl-CoA dehydrogenase NAD-binding domain-containing protein [Streptomyces sp. SRF1]|uniref:3-hydroxyacyl-CoA dehydrogenase family protein n=1 Tax=Streptomyces sp. SRF1 TaxID=1549642 RepID=UPI0025B1AD59|nr:3-hydroxyacyl-CoA dehydrogenase NAD-binding domain-containing protein [Streptomyces sp. SRF1]MDN3058996.1 3-hydroxyacyl-CoA dehydrogenase NAD-binding domain-containing protein [Streptomyces sp. SRF1]
MRDINCVGLVGLDTLGAGIAVVLAASGRSVIVVEADQPRLVAGRAALETAYDVTAGRDAGTAADREATLGRVVGTTDVARLAAVDLVVESVAEDLLTKKEALARAAATVAGHVPIVSSTSAFSITELAADLPSPGRFAGLHFFDPAAAPRTVEVVRGLKTADDTVDALVSFVSTLGGKEAVVVKDHPGFLVHSMLVPYLNDVVQALDDELASAEDLDIALKLGLGYKLGPLELLDTVGLDVHLRRTSALYAATGDARYAPPPLLRRMVAAGRLGAKNGRGFRMDDPRKDDA